MSESIFIVLGIVHYEGADVVSVHRSRSHAQMCVDNCDVKASVYDELKIEEHRVDDDPKNVTLRKWVEI